MINYHSDNSLTEEDVEEALEEIKNQVMSEIHKRELDNILEPSDFKVEEVDPTNKVNSLSMELEIKRRFTAWLESKIRTNH